MSKIKASVCPHDCPSACALEVECLDARTIAKVHGAKDNNYTQGVLCTKVANYAERVHHPDRLREPMVRVGKKGSGKFKTVSWDEALTRVADEFRRATIDSGAESVWPYYYAGTMGQVQRDGIIRLKNALGYSGMLKTICTQIAYAGWSAGAGAVRGTDPRDMLKSDLIIIWGCNAVATQINLMKLVAQARRERGATLVVIDPATTDTAKKADIHLALNPGSDGALAASLMHCAFRDGYADREYLQRMTDDPGGLEVSLIDKTPAWASEITGLTVEQIEQFAALYGQTQRSFIRLGIGFSRSRNGAHNVHSVSCLPAVTGAWQHPGGGALLGTSSIFKLDKTLIEGSDLRAGGGRDLDMSRIGAVLTGQPEDLKGGPPVKAMLIQNTNPMAVAPDLHKVHQGLAREDLFVCVHEQFMTETAKMADVLLPATTSMEHHDLYSSYGQVHLQLCEPVIEPYALCRSNHEVICELALRLGADDPGFKMDAKTMITQTLKDSGYPDYESLLAMKWLDCTEGVDMQFVDGFAWPDGKFRFKADWSAVGSNHQGMPQWPGHWDVTLKTSVELPYRLTTPPARYFLNSSFTQSPCSLEKEGRPVVTIHTGDAEKSRVIDGQQVEIGNQLGAIKLHAEVSDTIRPGVLEVRGVWPGTAFKEKIGVNSLIGADAAQPSGGVAFHDAAVWLRQVKGVVP
ncbi:MAG: molybdopterin-dependent oxidoreductase [Proteobacteria bacterium]|nr:molybdopterin-dependent oxidoreductase [Pseudomonadota bacterium]